MRILSCLALALALAVPAAGLPVEADDEADDEAGGGPRTRTLAADPGLAAGWLQKGLVGGAYRDLWQTPIEASELDLRTFAGGLTPQFRVGGKQTLGLALKGADGNSYTFRGLVKDLSPTLPRDFRGYLIGDIAQDQLAAAHPVGPVIVAPLAAAAGVPHTAPTVVVMPDDPALGEFRADFAGALGTLEEYPTPAKGARPGFLGAAEILSSRDFWLRMVDDPRERPDASAFLRARLLDFLVGDWDRHSKQWRWARVPGAGWLPIPEDRDQAFSSYEGLIVTLFRPYQPKFVRFETDYPSPTALTIQGWEITRWLLAPLERSDWLEVAEELKRRLNDEVIEQAVRRMPAAYLPWSAEELSAKLRSRRDRLPAYAGQVYEFLAKEVDVQGSDRDERFVLHSPGDGTLIVSVFADSDSSPYFHRRVLLRETNALRVFMRGGDDRLICEGEIRPAIAIHAVGEAAGDSLEACAGWDAGFIDVREFQRRQNPARSLSRPEPVDGPGKAPWSRARDWGWRTVPTYRAGFSSSLGPVAGAGVDLERYRFGRYPFEHKHSLAGAYSGRLNVFDVTYSAAYRPGDPRTSLHLKLDASGFALARFYGFGNETGSEGDSDFFRTRQVLYTLQPYLRRSLSSRLAVTAGGQVRYSDTDDDEDTLLNRLRPYGTDEFGEAGLFAGIEYEARDGSSGYAPGVSARLRGTLVPELADVESTYGYIEGGLAGYKGLGEDLVLSARLSGKKVFGVFPFQSAAYLGGYDSLRGYVSGRFAGESSLLLNTELRYVLGHASALFFRGEWGVFAFADTGRVWQDGESSRRWHSSAGGGLSLATLNRKLLVTATAARGEEDTTFFLQSGFSF